MGGMQPGAQARLMSQALRKLTGAIHKSDCIVIFIGDHGESFLEDGSAIHGLRLSKVQNMTPMVLHYPGVEPRVIQQRTSHIDILPTLFSLLQLPVNDGELLEGVDLTTAGPQMLDERIFATANMIDRSTGLIGPWTSDPQQPFAYRFVYNIGNWQINYLNPIDDQGYECPDPNPSNPVGERLFRQWVEGRIGAVAVDEQRSERELFTEYFRSDDPEIRKSALRIANDIAVPEAYLYDLIAEAALDPDPEIHEMAKEIVIRTERYVSRQ